MRYRAQLEFFGNQHERWREPHLQQTTNCLAYSSISHNFAHHPVSFWPSAISLMTLKTLSSLPRPQRHISFFHDLLATMMMFFPTTLLDRYSVDMGAGKSVLVMVSCSMAMMGLQLWLIPLQAGGQPQAQESLRNVQFTIDLRSVSLIGATRWAHDPGALGSPKSNPLRVTPRVKYLVCLFLNNCNHPSRFMVALI